MLRDRGFIQRRANPARQFHGIIVRPKMDEEHARFLVEHVAVDRGHRDIGGSQRANKQLSGLTSLPVTRKSPVMAALPFPVG